jgi:hypothetical protein
VTAAVSTEQAASFSGQVRDLLGLLLPTLSERGTAFWNHPDLRVRYPRYLVATHTVIRASVPLMRVAAEEARTRFADDPTTPLLCAYLDQHIPEETGHDDWVLEDLERMGVPSAVALEHPPSTVVAGLVGSQYYYVRHVHPAVLLGYIAVLEGYPPSEDLARIASARTGYPVEAFRTLRKHAHLDPHHRRDLDATLDRIPLTPRLAAAVRSNALQTMAGLIGLIDEINSGAPTTVLAHERAAAGRPMV